MVGVCSAGEDEIVGFSLPLALPLLPSPSPSPSTFSGSGVGGDGDGGVGDGASGGDEAGDEEEERDGDEVGGGSDTVTRPSDPELHFRFREMSKERVKCSVFFREVSSLGVLYAAGSDGVG